MRGFPLGIFYPPDKVYEVSIMCSRLTHHDPVSRPLLCVAQYNGERDVPGVQKKRAFVYARSRCRDAEVLDKLGSYERYRPEPSLDAVLCSHAALFCFMNARTFENAVLSAINLGGDADTVGACCGALTGAYWGIGAVPER